MDLVLAKWAAVAARAKALVLGTRIETGKICRHRRSGVLSKWLNAVGTLSAWVTAWRNLVQRRASGIRGVCAKRRQADASLLWSSVVGIFLKWAAAAFKEKAEHIAKQDLDIRRRQEQRYEDQKAALATQKEELQATCKKHELRQAALHEAVRALMAADKRQAQPDTMASHVVVSVRALLATRFGSLQAAWVHAVGQSSSGASLSRQGFLQLCDEASSGSSDMVSAAQAAWTLLNAANLDMIDFRRFSGGAILQAQTSSSCAQLPSRPPVTGTQPRSASVLHQGGQESPLRSGACSATTSPVSRIRGSLFVPAVERSPGTNPGPLDMSPRLLLYSVPPDGGKPRDGRGTQQGGVMLYSPHAQPRSDGQSTSPVHKHRAMPPTAPAGPRSPARVTRQIALGADSCSQAGSTRCLASQADLFDVGDGRPEPNGPLVLPVQSRQGDADDAHIRVAAVPQQFTAEQEPERSFIQAARGEQPSLDESSDTVSSMNLEPPSEAARPPWSVVWPVSRSASARTVGSDVVETGSAPVPGPQDTGLLSSMSSAVLRTGLASQRGAGPSSAGPSAILGRRPATARASTKSGSTSSLVVRPRRTTLDHSDVPTAAGRPLGSDPSIDWESQFDLSDYQEAPTPVDSVVKQRESVLGGVPTAIAGQALPRGVLRQVGGKPVSARASQRSVDGRRGHATPSQWGQALGLRSQKPAAAGRVGLPADIRPPGRSSVTMREPDQVSLSSSPPVQAATPPAGGRPSPPRDRLGPRSAPCGSREGSVTGRGSLERSYGAVLRQSRSQVADSVVRPSAKGDGVRVGVPRGVSKLGSPPAARTRAPPSAQAPR
mmetsp:Transcript_121541/g.278554  ORF Transcript_121541/g.278554 Transcript_121541/m.278554 type:complete len:832 (-) Transcript_121541:153-2648(-)